MEITKKLSKREIVNNFLSAGINISPKALQLLSLKIQTIQDLEILIREISYFPDFKLHLTEAILTKTKFFKGEKSNKEQSSLTINEEGTDLEEEFPESAYEDENSSNSTLNKVNNEIKEANEIADELTEKLPHSKKKVSNNDNAPQLDRNDLNISSSFGSMNRFKPLAKEYAAQVEILEDPNTNLYTSGSLDDFILQFKDRYTRLSEILLQNPDVKNVIPINQAKSLQTSENVNIIGMVVDKIPSRSGYAIKFSMDDQTGVIDVIVRNDEKNATTYENMNYLLKDEVVFVSGYLKVDNQFRTHTFYANEVIWPDVPLGNKSIIPQCPVSFALLSDLHIGSDMFLEDVFTRFIQYLKGELGTSKDQEQAGKIKYLIVCGDLVDGIGIYADQEKELKITDIYKQYEKAAELFSQIPDYVKIIYIPGNHEPVRKAIPHPSVPSKYCQPFLDLGVTSLGDPGLVELHGIKFLLYHGDGIIDMNNNIPGLLPTKPADTMREMLRCRHLSPTYGKECTEKAPTSIDWLTINQVPHVFHTGHMHINDLGHYRNVLLVNSGCFQAQTRFMKSLGINPTPGKVPIISEKYGKLDTMTLTLM